MPLMPSWNLNDAIRVEREAWTRWQVALKHLSRVQEEAVLIMSRARDSQLQAALQEALARVPVLPVGTCLTCGEAVREGLLYCPGLSICWRDGENVR